MKKVDRIELYQEWYIFLLNKGVNIRYAHLASMSIKNIYEIVPLSFFFTHGWELSQKHPEHYKTFQSVRRLKGKPYEITP